MSLSYRYNFLNFSLYVIGIQLQESSIHFFSYMYNFFYFSLYVLGMVSKKCPPPIPRKFSLRLRNISCNNVALPYFTFWYLPGEDYKSLGSLLWRKNILMHSLFECNIDKLYANHPFLSNCTAMFTIARLEVLLITQKKVFIEPNYSNWWMQI